MRGSDYRASPTFDQALTLPAGSPRFRANPQEAEGAWSDLLGGIPVVLVRSVAAARQLLLAAQNPVGVTVALPANVTDDLLGAVKDFGAHVIMVGLDDGRHLDLASAAAAGADLVWAQPAADVGGLITSASQSLWLDHSDTLPVPTRLGTAGIATADVILWGLHLSSDPARAGALLSFPSASGQALAAAVRRLVSANNACDTGAAVAQAYRWDGLAIRQLTAVRETKRGLFEAAGLPMLSAPESTAMPHGVVVVTPPECDPSTLYAYIARENTPIHWLPLLRPVHHASLRLGIGCPSTASQLAACLLIPVGPDYTAEEITHAVLGPVKAAEYLGIRWRTNPTRAAAYAAHLDDLYGSGHDAYRPVFDTSARSSTPLMPSIGAQ